MSVLRRCAAATAFLLTVSGVSLVASESAGASTPTETAQSESDLNSDFAINNSTVILGTSITITDGSNLSVPAGNSLTVDLNGHTLAVTDTPFFAGISVPASSSLTINDSQGGGVLDATGGLGGAGIGGESNVSVSVYTGYPLGGGPIGSQTFTQNASGTPGSGTVTINGGTINANGGGGNLGGFPVPVAGAGIGGGPGGSAGPVTVNGGTVNASGAGGGAGIGGGSSTGGFNGTGSSPTGPGGAGGTVMITNGTVTANGGSGRGFVSSGAGSYGGAGIGGGDGQPGGSTTISGGTVTASTGSGAGIGGGSFDATANSTTESGGANSGGTVTITGGTVTASGGDLTTNSGAPGIGIGAGPGSSGATIDVTGGSVNVGQLGDDGTATMTTISGGTVTATAGIDGGTLGISGVTVNAASIGGGSVTLTNATVTATSSVTGNLVKVDGGTVTTGKISGGGVSLTNAMVTAMSTLTGNPVTVDGGTVKTGQLGDGTGAVTITTGTVTTTSNLQASSVRVDGGTVNTGMIGAGSGPVTITGGTVTATSNVAAGTVTVNGGSLVAAAPQDTVGIPSPAISGSLVIGAQGSVALTSSSGQLPYGQRVGAVGGSVSNAGELTLDELAIPASTTDTNTGVLTVTGATYTLAGVDGVSFVDGITGDGSLANPGTIIANFQALEPCVVGQGFAACPTAPVQVPVSGHNYQVRFDAGGGPSATPTALNVYAASVAASQQSLPTVNPPSDNTFIGWQTSDGTLVSNSTDLSALLPAPVAGAPSAVTLTAEYAPIAHVTVTATQTYGDSSAVFSTGGPLPAHISGTVTCSTVDGGTPISSTLAAGTHTIDGSSCTGLNADTNYGLSITGGNFVVAPLAVTVDVAGDMLYGSTQILFYYVPGGLPDGISGSVTCATVDGGTPIGPDLSAGPHTIDGSSCSGLSADSNHTLTITGDLFQVVIKIDNVTVTGSQTYGDTSASFSADASSPSGDTGTVTCTTVDGGTPIDASLSVGSHTLDSSSCTGLSEVKGYSLRVTGSTFVVAPRASAIVVGTPTSSVYGQRVVFTAKVTSAGGVTAAPTGTVTFSVNGTQIGKPVTVSHGMAKVAATSAPMGSDTIVADYSGDGQHTASRATTQLQVSQAQTTTTPSVADGATITYGQPVTATIKTVAPSTAGIPASATGAIDYIDGNSTGPLRVTSSKTTVPAALLTAGSHSLQICYQGTTNLAGSCSSIINITVDQAATTTTLTSSANPATVGQKVTLTAKVAPRTTGTVTFYDDGTMLGQANLSNGAARINVRFTTADTHPISAMFNGNDNLLSSTSNTVSEQVN